MYDKDFFENDLFEVFYEFFRQNIGNTFHLNRHTDPSLTDKPLIRIIKPYQQHVCVEILSQKFQSRFKTSITYSTLLDNDNSNRLPYYEIQKYASF